MLAVLGLAAATCSPALAESGTPDLPMPAVPDLTAAAATVLADATIQEVLPEAATAVLPALGPVAAPPTALPAVPAQEAAAEPVNGAVAAPPPEPAPPPRAAPTPVRPAPDAPPASVGQSQPANVNVSVRVDSPGDDGSVDQENAAAAEATTAARYQPDDPRYQPPVADASTAETAATSDAAGPADASTWDWTWSWNCVDPIPELPASPSGSLQNWTWNWNWDCGAPGLPDRNATPQSGGQYQPAVSQYRPVNINVSIRINSPGNDGPVRQANTASASTTFLLPTMRIVAPATPEGGTAVPEAGTTTFVVASVPVLGSLEAEVPAPFVEFLFGEPTRADGCCPVRPSPADPSHVVDAPAVFRRQSAPTPDLARRDITAPARFRASVEVTMRLTRASVEAAREARTGSKPVRTLRPAPASRPAGGAREPALVRSSGYAPPLNAPDGRFGWVFLFAAGIGLVFAFAAATRSVAADVRVRGEDPDPPPDRPG